MQKKRALGFLIALFIIPFLAWLKPEIGATHGFLSAEILTQICVVLIFLLSGLCFKPIDVFQASQNYKLNLAVQLFCFSFIPYLVFLASRTLLPASGLYQPFIIGSLIMSTVPLTTSSCVIFTSLVKGDEKGALFNAILSNFIGVFTAPLALKFLLRFNGIDLSVNPWPIMLKLFALTILPLTVGQFLSLALPSGLDKRNLFLRGSEILLFFIVYSAFCDSFQQIQAAQFPWDGIRLLIFWMVFFHLLFLGLSYLAGKIFRFSPEEQKTLLFTAPQKTVAVGIPLILAVADSLSETSRAEAAFFMLPLLLYNNIQWLAAGMLSYIMNRD